jgi:hypothetical protein
MTVHDPPISRHEVPPGVAVAVTRWPTAVDPDGSAITQMAVSDGAAELGNIGPADVGMTGVDWHD